MKNDRLLAARYAEALSQAVPNLQDLSSALAGLRTISDLMHRSDELRQALKSPTIAPAAKGRVMQAIGQRVGLSAAGQHFLTTLATHGHLMLLGGINEAIATVANRRSGIADVEITTATPLDAATLDRLRTALEKVAGSRLSFSQSVDSSILGGVIARIGATVYDGSLRSKLEKLRSRLAG